MAFSVFAKFNLLKERETYTNVKKTIDNSISVEGTNLWILFFAILIASLGLNTNSTAVVIGAMLISPLIGPIVGLGFGVATNDLKLIKVGLVGYLFSTLVGVSASLIYFLITPIQEAHSEILARVSPSLYDVLIALFGGFAGAIALTSKQKGNVIPGVAIATAIMPPLCTAGYGLATLQFDFFFGAFYLFLINSVFIFAATITTVRFLRFRVKKYDDPKLEIREKYITWSIVILTLLPSVYLGYGLVQENNFINSAENFISNEAVFPNDFLLKKKIDPTAKTIDLTFGGRIIQPDETEILKKKLKYYGLADCDLRIINGFSFDDDNKNLKEWENINKVISETSMEKNLLQAKIDSTENQKKISELIFDEMRVLFPSIDEAVIQPVFVNTDTSRVSQKRFLVLVTTKNNLDNKQIETLKAWMEKRTKSEGIELVQKKKM